MNNINERKYLETNLDEDIDIFLDNNSTISDMNGYNIKLDKIKQLIHKETEREEIEAKLEKKLKLNDLLEKEKYYKSYISELNDNLENFNELLEGLNKTNPDTDFSLKIIDFKGSIEMQAEKIGDELIMIREKMKDLYKS